MNLYYYVIGSTEALPLTVIIGDYAYYAIDWETGVSSLDNIDSQSF